MARPTKYNDEIHAELVRLISSGVTMADACRYTRISDETFRNWKRRYLDFLTDITRAQGQANVGATVAIRSAIQGAKQVTTTNDVITETRLRKVKDSKGNIVEEPYQYTKTVKGTTVTEFPPDWRAAVEYLKRRDPEHWSEKTNIKLETWETELVALLRAGKITPEQVTAELGMSLAERLFNAAGIPATTST